MEQDRAKWLETRRKYYEETLPPMLKKLEAFVCTNPHGQSYIIGKSMTMCDIYIVYFYSYDLYTIHKDIAVKAWAQGKLHTGNS
jgi:glutathione S-transferase